MSLCPSTERLLDSIARQGVLSQEERAHVVACEACQREIASFDEIIAALESAREEKLPPGWTDRVMAELPAPPEAARVPTHPLRVIWASLPTFVLATVTVFLALLFFAPGGIGTLSLGLGYAVAVGMAATLVEAVLTRSGATALPT